MESGQHSLTNLFTQLGLPSSAPEIQAFIQSHRPLDAKVALSEAPFWTTPQAKFLRDQIENDADWAGVVDKLNTILR